MFGPGVMVGSRRAADGVTIAARLGTRSAEPTSALAYILEVWAANSVLEVELSFCKQVRDRRKHAEFEQARFPEPLFQ